MLKEIHSVLDNINSDIVTLFDKLDKNEMSMTNYRVEQLQKVQRDIKFAKHNTLSISKENLHLYFPEIEELFNLYLRCVRYVGYVESVTKLHVTIKALIVYYNTYYRRNPIL